MILRPAVESDYPYIVESWLASYRGQAIARDAGRGYVHDFKWFIRKLIAKSAVLVAADEEEHGVIWGWAATHGETILYVYVRQDFRRQGLGRLLVRPFLEQPAIYAARSHVRLNLPAAWRYSFLQAVRIAAE